MISLKSQMERMTLSSYPVLIRLVPYLDHKTLMLIQSHSVVKTVISRLTRIFISKFPEINTVSFINIIDKRKLFLEIVYFLNRYRYWDLSKISFNNLTFSRCHGSRQVKVQTNCISWFRKDQLHREIGPAWMSWYANGQRRDATWALKGKTHCINGPAVQSWYQNGVLCKECWRQNNELHRLDGPARIVWQENGQLYYKGWYLHDKIISAEYSN